MIRDRIDSLLADPRGAYRQAKGRLPMGNADDLLLCGLFAWQVCNDWDRDNQRAARLLGMAADAGNAEAMYYFAAMWAGGAEKCDCAMSAVEYLNKSAENGYGPAVEVFAATGLPVSSDYKEASSRVLCAELLVRIELEKKSFWGPLEDAYILQSPEARASYGFRDKVINAAERKLNNLPPGEKLPAPAGRGIRVLPDLKRGNPSFAALLIRYVHERFDGDAAAVYKAAHIDRKTYSSIVSNEARPVSKRTVVCFGFALHLPHYEFACLLESAGYALSSAILEDVIYKACMDVGLYELDRISRLLVAHQLPSLVAEA